MKPVSDGRLSINFDDNRLYYALSRPTLSNVVERIGRIDFSFDLIHSFTERGSSTKKSLSETIEKFIHEEKVTEIVLLVPPAFECWSMMPKTVFNDEKERAAQISILSKGFNQDKTYYVTHEVSNRDFTMISLRRQHLSDEMQNLVNGGADIGLCSDFELGKYWASKHAPGGSFLMVSVYNGLVALSSYIFGKLRGATYFRYDDLQDIPYLWLQYASHLNWIQGLHDQIFVFGKNAPNINEMMEGIWVDSSEIVLLDSLEKMKAESHEKAFSFPLEVAFPSILLSVT